MSFRHSHFGLSLALSAIAGVLLACAVQAAEPQRGSKLRFSDTPHTEIGTNLSALNKKGQNLRELENELFKPASPFTPDSSLGGMPASMLPRMNRVAVPSKKAQQLMERRKNWEFLTPEELMSGANEEDSSKSRDGKESSDEEKYKKSFGLEKMKLSPVEQYYLNLSRQNDSKARDEKRRKETDGNDDFRAHGDSDLPGTLKEKEQDLKRLIRDGDSVDSFGGRSGFSDVFGTTIERNETSASDPATRAQKARMEEFRKLIGFPSSALSTADQLRQLSTAPEPVRPGLTPLVTPPASPSRRDGFDVQLGVIPSLPTVPDVNSRMGLPSLTPVMPKVDTTSRVAPPTPTFAAPRRTF